MFKRFSHLRPWRQVGDLRKTHRHNPGVASLNFGELGVKLSMRCRSIPDKTSTVEISLSMMIWQGTSSSMVIS
ncbi:unnamed protein product [Arabis nemorensis]|uniref:Uncharacterized protein n=1 Tax=Arabis nemorensis TaxID=586526 RepID=A0A565ATV0_9BRAS|nr:unnamed protein product [Arabis nemorensis]